MSSALKQQAKDLEVYWQAAAQELGESHSASSRVHLPSKKFRIEVGVWPKVCVRRLITLDIEKAVFNTFASIDTGQERSTWLPWCTDRNLGGPLGSLEGVRISLSAEPA